MKTKYITQVERDSLIEIEFDLIITASGYESRSIYIAEQLKKDENSSKYVFGFPDFKTDEKRIFNDNYFHERGYTYVECLTKDTKEIINCIRNFVENTKKETLSILIDYSSMSRNWYGNIINFFKLFDSRNIKIIVYFSYSNAKFYNPSEEEPLITTFEPIMGYCNLTVPSSPTALITAIGYEKNKAFGLREYFDAEVLNLFYTDDNEFSKKVKEINSDVLNKTLDDFKYSYLLKDLLYTKSILYDLCVKLKANYRVIIAPCGPKPFTLISFLVASSMDLVDVWRISGIDHQSDRIANGEIHTLELCYE